jgi:hypothetical protein
MFGNRPRCSGEAQPEYAQPDYDKEYLPLPGGSTRIWSAPARDVTPAMVAVCREAEAPATPRPSHCRPLRRSRVFRYGIMYR